MDFDNIFSIDEDRIKISLEHMKKQPIYWKFGDSILYKMCRENPGHSDEDIVAGKLLIIGRTYAAAVERRNKEKIGKYMDTEEFYYKRAVPALMTVKDLDIVLAELNHPTHPNEDSIDRILRLHKQLADAFDAAELPEIGYTVITGMKKRSLASKYLHFHCPHKFFIYDERARANISKLIKLKKVRFNSKDYDQEYASFYQKALILQKYLMKQGKNHTPRDIDNLLLYNTI